MSAIVSPEGIIDPTSTPWQYQLALWAERSGIKVDGAPFSFMGHRYLFPIFMDYSPQIVWLKAAQMGATIWQFLRSTHQALFYPAWGFTRPVKVGYYFPDEPNLNLMVKGRVEPLMKSSPDLAPYSGEKTRRLKPIGDSAIYFFYMKGKSSKDATPLMSIFFDEVRLMDLKDISQAKKRVLHSEIKYMQFVSTAGYPKGDIHKMFLDSDQKYWTTFCERCGHEFVMALEFPECIADHTHGPMAGQCYYRCVKCKGRIDDNQRGGYIAHGDPYHEVSGYHVSQLISTLRTAREVLKEFRDTDNMKEFYNAELGLPYVDEVNRPVSLEMLDSNINPVLRWGDGFAGDNFMGVDQMGGLNYIFVLNRDRSSRILRAVHFEIVQDRDPFVRTAKLMDEYNIKVCVCDSEPNFNDALKFAGHFGRRVFLAKYGKYDDMVRWHDSFKPKKYHKKAGPESFHRYRVLIDKFKSIDRTLGFIAKGQVEWPSPEDLIQRVFPLKGGSKEPMPILRTHAYEHFSCAVKERVDKDAEASKYEWKWVFVDYDPHSLIAMDLAITAGSRKRGGIIWTPS